MKIELIQGSFLCGYDSMNAISHMKIYEYIKRKIKLRMGGNECA